MVGRKRGRQTCPTSLLRVVRNLAKQDIGQDKPVLSAMQHGEDNLHPGPFAKDAGRRRVEQPIKRAAIKANIHCHSAASSLALALGLG